MVGTGTGEGVGHKGAVPESAGAARPAPESAPAPVNPEREAFRIAFATLLATIEEGPTEEAAQQLELNSLAGRAGLGANNGWIFPAALAQVASGNVFRDNGPEVVTRFVTVVDRSLKAVRAGETGLDADLRALAPIFSQWAYQTSHQARSAKS